MMTGKTTTAHLIESDRFLARSVCSSLRNVALRYMRWRAASHVRRLDARTLKDIGIHPDAILSLVNEIDNAP